MFQDSKMMKEMCLNLLAERGVALHEIAELVLLLQKPYVPTLNLDTCLIHVERVISKREVQNAIITGIFLDKMAEEKKIDEPLQSIIEQDEGLYGVDEIMALSIVNVYGSIGFTNYGFLDKSKPGILKKLNNKNGDKCHTFLDDIVAAIAASAASRFAHTINETE